MRRKPYAAWPPAAAAAILGLLAALSGCQSYSSTTSTGNSATGPAASPVQHPLLTNVPLPVGFRMVPERSVARGSGRFRMAICEFEGTTPPERVTSFYQNYMPSANFALRTTSLVNGEYKLRFESDTEECSIYVRRERQATRLVIDLGPLPRGTAEREPRPPVRRQ